MTAAAHSGPLVVIVGPTAVGKTALALWLADDLDVEVVSADSRQVYRGMDIGTAKPTRQERERVKHHLLDVVDPDEPFTLAQYQDLAYAAIDGAQLRECIPLLVGGTGLYVRAVLEGFSIPRVEPDECLRKELYAKAAAEGYKALHRRLQELDPVAAERIDGRNVRRVVRALEVCLQTGKPISSLQQASPPPYRMLQIGLTMPRDLLYQRLDQRVDRMLSSGLVSEVRSLVELGYSDELPSMSGLGYRQICLYLSGDVSLDEATALIKQQTRRFVRQQGNWFREDDLRITWYDASQPVFAETVLARIRHFLEE